MGGWIFAGTKLNVVLQFTGLFYLLLYSMSQVTVLLYFLDYRSTKSNYTDHIKEYCAVFQTTPLNSIPISGPELQNINQTGTLFP